MEKKESSGLADLPTDQKWLTKPLQFAVTSDKAFEVQKAKEYEETIGTGKNFENFATQGDSQKRLDFLRKNEWYEANKHQ